MAGLWYILIFFLGASVGSFVNVLVSRTVAGREWVRGRSGCDYCKKNLAWYDMIPLLSYGVYRGKSRCCNKQLSWQHPLVEALSGALFLWWAVMGQVFFHLVTHPLTIIQPLYWLVTGVLLIIILVMDMYYGLIPTKVVIVGSVMTILYRGLLLLYGAYQLKDFLLLLASALLAYTMFWLLRRITRNKGMGGGDVDLAAYVGLLSGWPRVGVALWMSFVIGAVVGLTLMLLGKKKLGQSIPFGPFMILGLVSALLWGERILGQIY